MDPKIISTDLAKAENQTNQSHIFSNHLILQEIFKHLPLSDLLNLSRVNRFWKSNARSVLRETKTCLVKISPRNPCSDLQEFIKFLPEISQIPYNGFSIHTPFYYENTHECVRDHDRHEWDFSKYCFEILNRINIKHMELNWDDRISCPIISFIKSIVNQSHLSLEKLYLKSLPRGLFTISNYFFNSDDENLCAQDHQIILPRLRHFECPPFPIFVTSDSIKVGRIVEDLLSIAPNITCVFGKVKIPFLKSTLCCERFSCQRELTLKSGSNLTTQRKTKLSVTTEYLRTNPVEVPSRAMNPFTRILEAIIKGEGSELEELHISLLDLILLRQSGQSEYLKTVKNLVVTNSLSDQDSKTFEVLTDSHKIMNNQGVLEGEAEEKQENSVLCFEQKLGLSVCKYK